MTTIKITGFVRLESEGTLDSKLEAIGFTFHVGAAPGEGAGEIPFDSTMRSDLILSVLDSDLSILGTSNLARGMESLSGISVVTGDYFIRVEGIDNSDANVFYGLSASFSASGVPEPNSDALLVLGVVGICLLRRRSGISLHLMAALSSKPNTGVRGLLKPAQ